MNSKYTLTAVIAVLALGAAGAVVGQGPSFEDLDADKSGLIDRSEATAFPCLASNFDSIKKKDKNGVSAQEFAEAVSTYCAG